MSEPLFLAPPSEAPKRSWWITAGWVLLALCHALVVWGARAIEAVPLWLLIVAALFLATAGPQLLDQLDGGDRPPAGTPPLSAAEKDNIARVMVGYVFAILLTAAFTVCFLFPSTEASSRTRFEVVRTNGSLTETRRIEAPLAWELRGSIDAVR